MNECKKEKKGGIFIPKEHQMNCNICGQMMDLRDISQVFAHEECNGIPIDYEVMEQVSYSSSQKIGTQEVHTKNNGVINLN